MIIEKYDKCETSKYLLLEKKSFKIDRCKYIMTAICQKDFMVKKNASLSTQT